MLTSCVSTHISSSWKDPDKQVNERLNKVLVAAFFKSETSSRRAEDQMVVYLGGKGAAAYNYLNDSISTKNEEAIRDRTRAGGFDGAITMRLIDVDKEESYTPGNVTSYPVYFRSFGGYYYRTWAYYRTPGYYTTTKTYTVETNLYSMKEDKIIWTGVTQTTNPSGVDKLTEEVAKVIYNKLTEEGFLAK